jgi:hypothetical protein
MDLKIGVICLKGRTISIVRCLICVFLILCGLLNFNVAADKGMVPINPVEIALYEPGQKAIICWDGTEEILILSTDVRAEEPTKVLEIFPLPDLPTVEMCNKTIFEELTELARPKQYLSAGEKGSGGHDALDIPPPDVEVVFHETLGVHDLTIIKALTSDGFATWVNDFLESSGLTPMSFPKAEKMAASYIERDINYFVLDILELTGDLKSPEPIMYRFNSSGVYYPMEVSSLTGGESHILLFILTPYEVLDGPYEKKEIEDFEETVTTWQNEQCIEVEWPDSPVDFQKLTTTSVSTNWLEYRINDDFGNHDVAMAEVYNFFKEHKEIKMGVYEYYGTVELEGDIYITDYSIEKVTLDVEYTNTTPDPDFCTPIWLPVGVVVIIPFGIFTRFKRRNSKNK